MTINEVLEEHFMAYLQQYGYTYADDPKKLEEVLADIHANATVKYDDAIIDFESKKQINRKRDNIGDPKVYTNQETVDHTEQFQRSVTYSVGSEITKTKWRGWSTTGGLTASYQGAGASATVTYERGKAEVQTQVESTQRTEWFDEYVLVPSETRVKVVVEKQFMIFNCKVLNLKVTFKKSKFQIKCKVQFGPKSQMKTETFKFMEIFKNDVITSNQKGVTIRMGGKYVWPETSVHLRRYDPEPLKGLDIT